MFEDRGKIGFGVFADLVADAGGVLEFQVAGMLVHLLFQRLQLRGDLRGRHHRVIGGFLGHAAGDRVLETVSERLARILPKGATLPVPMQGRVGRVDRY